VYHYAFEADCWHETIPRANIATLSRVFRQTDGDFVRILEELRLGRISQPDLRALQELDRPLYFDDGVEPVNMSVRGMTG
jgi:ATP-dependent DNA helicase PIF1